MPWEARHRHGRSLRTPRVSRDMLPSSLLGQRSPRRWVVIDEVVAQVDIDGIELSTAEQGVDELPNDLLVRVKVGHGLTVTR